MEFNELPLPSSDHAGPAEPARHFQAHSVSLAATMSDVRVSS